MIVKLEGSIHLLFFEHIWSVSLSFSFLGGVGDRKWICAFLLSTWICLLKELELMTSLCVWSKLFCMKL